MASTSVPASPSLPSSPRRWRGPKFGLALPSIFWYAAFFVAPIAFIVVYSFGIKDTSSTTGVPIDLSSPTLQNYRDTLSDTFRTVFTSTLRIAMIATLLCVAIGFPVAYFLAYKVSEKWRTILLALVIIPSFSSFLIRTIAWRIPLSTNGTLSKWLQDWGLIDRGLQVLETSAAVQLAIVYNYLGFMILPLFVALDRIEPGLREASKDLGAGRLRTFSQVTLPLAAPGIAAGVLLTFIPMCGDFITATILGGTKGFMIGALVESQFRQAQNWPLGSAMAVVMIVLVLVALAIAGLTIMIIRAGLRFRRAVTLTGVPT